MVGFLTETTTCVVAKPLVQCYSNTMFACLHVCLWPISSGKAGSIWLILFLLAPSWSEGGFRPKKFRIRSPVCTEKLAARRSTLSTASHLL